jgi:hypothetical protein
MQRTALLACCLLPLCGAVAGVGARVADFALPDQFGVTNQVRFPRGRPVLLILGDRRGSEQVAGWVLPLKQRWGHGADILGVADVSAAPGFLRARVTESIRRQLTDYPLLLDFAGVVADALHGEKRVANVFLVATNGVVAAATNGAVDDAKLAALAREADRLVPPPAAP